MIRKCFGIPCLVCYAVFFTVIFILLATKSVYAWVWVTHHPDAALTRSCTGGLVNNKFVRAQDAGKSVTSFVIANGATGISQARKANIRATTTCLMGTDVDDISNEDEQDEDEDEDDGYNENPDLTGVYVDGFPLPPIPVYENDDELMARIRRVPMMPMTDLAEPLESRPLSIQNEGTTLGSSSSSSSSSSRPLRVLIAGGGLGGLATASALIQFIGGQSGNNVDVDVHILEQAKEYKPFGGPIQIQSNALWALQQINPTLYQAIADCGVRTGDRLSGIKDGKRYSEGWLVKFDAATPAIRNGLPLTLAINRVVLQEIFLKYGVPRERVHTSSRVVSYRNVNNGGVEVTLQDGTRIYGDILIGADGIWSRIRHQMVGLPSNEVGFKYANKHASYSGYTCFTGTCRHTPADIRDVAYKVFLGQEQYFGCTDTGHGWQHWWAFLPDEPPNSSADEVHVAKDKNRVSLDDTSDAFLQRLQNEFRDWSPEILDLFEATNPEVVKRRPLYDRPPMFKDGWTDQCVALLGDAAHPTMPNLGQGGAMAIEDAYALGKELQGITDTDEIPQRLKAYERRRFIRASIAQYLSRNGSDLLVDWEKVRCTPIVGPIAMWCVNVFQPISMNYLYSAKF